MKTPRLFSVLKESVGKLFSHGVVVSIPSSSWGTTPTDPTFSDVLDYYERDADIKSAIDDLTERSVGAGFWTICAEGMEEAKKIIDDFCEIVGLDQMNFWISRDDWLAGNSFLEKVWEKSSIQKTLIDAETGETADLMTCEKGSKFIGLTNIPLDAIKKIKFSKTGQIQYLEAGVGIDTVLLSPSNFIHYCWNRVSSNPLGVGLINPLIKQGHGFFRTSTSTEREYRPSILEISERMEVDMAKILNNFAEPNQIIVLEGVDDNEMAAKKDEIKALKAGERFATNRPAQIISSTTDFRAKFDPFINHFDNLKIKALQTPTPKLFTVPGFTEASANAAVKISEVKIRGFQRFLKRMHEREIFEPLLRQAGFDPAKVQVRINWGMPAEPQPVEFDALTRFIQAQAMSGQEILSPETIRQYVAKTWGIENVEVPAAGSRPLQPLQEQERELTDLKKKTYKKILEKLS